MQKMWVDPPSGWRYGFPKVYDPDAGIPDMRVWLWTNGYPERDLDLAVKYLRMWEVTERVS